MTTHSPETVALIPKNNKKSLFIMDFDVNTNQVNIKNAVNKYQALQLLASDVIQINDSFRLVFVESSIDKLFYEYVNSYLTRNHPLSNNEQLVFRYHSTGAFKDKADKSDQVKEIKAGHLNDVQRLVEKFTTVCGDNKPLESFIYGLVGQDYLEYIKPESRREHCEKEYQQVKNVIVVDRRSSVNYILDPIHVFYYAYANNKLAINDYIES
ncbi:unnamed protein product, partial [Rotaria sordida]